ARSMLMRIRAYHSRRAATTRGRAFGAITCTPALPSSLRMLARAPNASIGGEAAELARATTVGLGEGSRDRSPTARTDLARAAPHPGVDEVRAPTVRTGCPAVPSSVNVR